MQQLGEQLLFVRRKNTQKFRCGRRVGTCPSLGLLPAGRRRLQQRDPAVGVVGAALDEALADECVDQRGGGALSDANGSGKVGEPDRTAAVHFEQNLRPRGGHPVVTKALVERSDECLTGATESVGEIDGSPSGFGIVC